MLTTITTLQAAGLVSAPRIAVDDGRTPSAVEIVERALSPRFEVANADPLAAALHRRLGFLVSPLAAALRLRGQLAGKRLALIASGGNVSPAQLRELLA